MIGKKSTKLHYLKKKSFYSNLNLENINDVDSKHSKKGCKDFEIKNLGEYSRLWIHYC